ncbi:hypothetical protein [Terrimonas alba]|uniref:hypothetical protein n=1 Tax=Terrimonas alba TaxID=3349636 RepID=UPI0035F3E683
MLALLKKTKTEIWEGNYKYDEHHSFSKDYGVPFTIELKRKWFGRIEGVVQDDFNKGGMKEKGKIKGRIKANQITFVKRMPNFFGHDLLGNPINLNIPHPLLHYKGNFNSLKKNLKAHGALIRLYLKEKITSTIKAVPPLEDGK